MKPTICYYYKSLWHTLSRIYNIEAAKNGITTSIGFVLLNIDIQYGTPATKIAPCIGLENKSLSRMLTGMEKKKLIYRKADNKDKRIVRIFLTEEGRKKKDIAKKTVQHLNKILKEQIGESKLHSFIEVSNQINDIIKNKPVFSK